MKIFWSWQSDHPGAVSRHFVREALELAVASLNQELAIEEPERPGALRISATAAHRPRSLRRRLLRSGLGPSRLIGCFSPESRNLISRACSSTVKGRLWR